MSDDGHNPEKTAQVRVRKPGRSSSKPPPTRPAPPALFEDLSDDLSHGIAPLTDWEVDSTVVVGKPEVQGSVSPPLNQAFDGLMSSIVRQTSSTETPPATQAAKLTRSLDQQMFVLMGGRSFAQREPSRQGVTKRHVMRRRPSFTRIVAAVVFIALGVFAAAVISFGLEQRSQRDADEIAKRLENASATGALAEAESLVKAIEGSEEETPAQAKLVAKTEALLFRNRDAQLQRLARARERLPLFTKADVDTVVEVRAVLASRAERVAMVGELRRVAAASDTSVPEFLLATALSRAGVPKEATEHFETALDRDPSNLEHLAAFALHCIAGEMLNEAEDTLEIMREVSPTAPWTRMVALRLNRAQKTNRHTVPEDTEATSTPVGESQLLMAQAVLRHIDGDSGAEERVKKAGLLVHHQPAFVIDMVDQLLAADWPEAARDLLQKSSIGGGSPAIVATLGRVALADGNTEEATAKLKEAFDAGYRDPVAGLAYIEALKASGNSAADRAERAEIRAQLFAVWPQRADLKPQVVKRKRVRSKTKKRRRRGRKRRR